MIALDTTTGTIWFSQVQDSTSINYDKLRINIFNEGGGRELADLNNSKAIELRDYLNKCYPAIKGDK